MNTDVTKPRSFDDVDVTKPMLFDDFWILFSHLPLTDEEKISLKTEYFEIYELFLNNDVAPETAWLATRNMFVMKMGDEISKRQNIIEDKD